MNKQSVVIFDYGSGNIHSVAKAFEKAGADVELTRDRGTALNADALVVPGVGAFTSVMDGLRSIQGDRIIDQRLAGGRPVLGICVGMQVLFDRGVERGIETGGLGQWSGTVTRLEAPTVPHMGWNSVEAAEGSILFDGIDQERFYFVHSYAAQEWRVEIDAPFPVPRVTWAHHGSRFVAAVENGPLSATQFHPEKSGEAGIRLLTNWLGSL